MKREEFRIITDQNRTPGAIPEKDGIHFGYYAYGTEIPELLLYPKGSREIAARLPFPQSECNDGYYSMKVKLSPAAYEYNFCEGGEVITDPCAVRIAGREQFGQVPDGDPHAIRGGFAETGFHWGDDHLPAIPYHDVIMYHLHVRGFTMQKNSGVRKKGTFAGLIEKIPYLNALGINQVKVMPVYEFDDRISPLPRKRKQPKTQQEAAERAFEQLRADSYRLNYWGYGTGYYFAPKAAYAASAHPVREFKQMVRAFHKAGIEVVLEFSFADFMDISQISRCLTYWAEEYHVDGFAVMARDSLIAELARLPLFRTRKLIATWYPDWVKAYNKEEAHCLLAESNDGFMNDCRKMLRGDEETLSAFSYRLRSSEPYCWQINYMTNHDGFTLMDLVSYEQKYNMENGEQDRDGTDYNCSWNCGAEGPTKKRSILALRMRQRKNAYAMMLFAQGTPMLLAGDEFGNSQNGNNNPYCHDSELTWLDWSKTRSNRELTKFVQECIAFRKTHKVLHQDRKLQCADQLSSGFPDLSFHGDRAWYGDFERMRRHLGCMYSGYYAGESNFIYIAYNFNWNTQEFALPLLPKGLGWYPVMDTSQKQSFVPEDMQEALGDVRSFQVEPRTIVVLEGR
jgi:glycogen operon protein